MILERVFTVYFIEINQVGLPAWEYSAEPSCDLPPLLVWKHISACPLNINRNTQPVILKISIQFCQNKLASMQGAIL